MRVHAVVACMIIVGAGTLPARAQHAPLDAPEARVAVLDVALHNVNATSRVPADSIPAALATRVLHAALADLLPGQLADSAAVHAAVRSDVAVATVGRYPCDVVVACARAAARAVDARWVVLAKMGKVAAVWLLTAQLVHVPSGTIGLDDSTELTGQEAMVRAGARNLANRIARTIRAGGVATNFPAP